MRVLLFALIIFSKITFAQNTTRVETPFNSFIKSPNVLWAINANDTIRFEKPNLAAFLVKKMYAGKIKTADSYFENDSKDENNLRYISISECNEIINGNHGEDDMPIFDSLGNIIQIKKRKNKFDSISPLIKLNQKIYIENNKLLSYISYVSPMKRFITPQGLDLGDGPLFATAINKQYDATSSSNDKVISLGNTTRTFYMDSINNYESCKTTLGRNLIESLWPSIENNKIELYSYPENKKLQFKEMNEKYSLNEEQVEVPVFDNNGLKIQTIKAVNESKSNIVDKITITQNWFYNDTKNIVFCKISSAIISFKNINDNTTTNKVSGQIKLVF